MRGFIFNIIVKFTFKNKFMNWEIIGVIVGIIALVVAIQTYHRQFNLPPPVFPEPEPTAEKDNLKAHFKMTQKLALEVQSLIQQHVDEGNGNKFISRSNISTMSNTSKNRV